MDKLDSYIDRKFVPKPEKESKFTNLNVFGNLQDAIKKQLISCDKDQYLDLDTKKCVACKTCEDGEYISIRCDGTTTMDVVECSTCSITGYPMPAISDAACPPGEYIVNPCLGTGFSDTAECKACDCDGDNLFCFNGACSDSEVAENISLEQALQGLITGGFLSSYGSNVPKLFIEVTITVLGGTDGGAPNSGSARSERNGDL